MDRRHSLVAVLLIAVLWLVAKPAAAGYAYPTPPTGWGGSSGAWTYGGTAAANADWFNGRAAANVTVNVGGRAVTVPAAMRTAANAGSVIARAALVVTPWGRAIQFAQWAQVGSWIWDEANQQWLAPKTVLAAGWEWNISGYKSGSCQGAVDAYRNAAGYPGAAECYNFGTHENGNPTASWRIRAVNGNCCVESGNVMADAKQMPTTVHEPATDSDADELAADHPIPEEALEEAQKHLPVPMDLPIINPYPDLAGDAVPLRVPQGEPVPVPNTNPQRYDQPVTDIVPAPSPATPWRVDVQPKIVQGEDPVGVEEPEPVVDGDPVGEPNAEGKTDCDKYPEASGCKPLDVPNDTTQIPEVTIPVAINPDGGWGADNAACPADRSVSMLGQNIPIPFTLFCQYFSGLRYVIIAFAWLGAGFILLGARSD